MGALFAQTAVTLSKLAVAPLLIALCGILRIRQTKTRWAVAAAILTHALTWPFILFGLFYWAPTVKRDLDQAGIEPPAVTELIIRIDDSILQAAGHPLPSAVLLGILLAIVSIDGYVVSLLWRRSATTAARSAWSIAITAMLFAIVVIGEAATFVPQAG